MRKLFFIALLLSFITNAQDNQEAVIFENVMLTVQPGKSKQFEKAVAYHNKKFHNQDAYGCRVYWIASGPNSGKYIWSMPSTWSSMDTRPQDENGHNDDWAANVEPTLKAEVHTSYWKTNDKHSRIHKDFKLDKLLITFFDIKRGKGKEAMDLIAKVKKVYAEKIPNETYGVYTNEMGSTKEGRDLALVWFFEKSSWMSDDHEFPKKYGEMYGEGSWDTFLKEWYDATNGSETELWVYRPDLSGLSAEVVAASN
ncbi:hypothetical protein [Leptobacterium sp. I13]|uniref:hypothetical protein n=1 Tax=Leptobacterium meishanense TaxID=3128904 RepID=UPI0030EDACCD